MFQGCEQASQWQPSDTLLRSRFRKSMRHRTLPTIEQTKYREQLNEGNYHSLEMSFCIKLIFEGVNPSRLLAQAAMLTNKSRGLPGCDAHHGFNTELISRPQGRGPSLAQPTRTSWTRANGSFCFPRRRPGKKHSANLSTKASRSYCHLWEF